MDACRLNNAYEDTCSLHCYDQATCCEDNLNDVAKFSLTRDEVKPLPKVANIITDNFI